LDHSGSSPARHSVAALCEEVTACVCFLFEPDCLYQLCGTKYQILPFPHTAWELKRLQCGPKRYIGFEVFTAVVMKSIILWDVMPCSPLSLFDPEDGGEKFLRNVGRNSTDYTAPYPRSWYPS
jgi:hypothetical protein